MKIVRTTTVAGLVLAAGALPVTAYALSWADQPTAPPTSVHAQPETADAPETDAPETEAPDTEAPDTEAPGPDASGTPNPGSAPGRAHAAAMQAWAHCVGQAASGPKTPGQQMPPKLACGDKPPAPGQAKHWSAAAGAPVTPKASPGHGHARGHAKGR